MFNKYFGALSANLSILTNYTLQQSKKEKGKRQTNKKNSKLQKKTRQTKSTKKNPALNITPKDINPYLQVRKFLMRACLLVCCVVFFSVTLVLGRVIARERCRYMLKARWLLQDRTLAIYAPYLENYFLFLVFAYLSSQVAQH